MAWHGENDRSNSKDVSAPDVEVRIAEGDLMRLRQHLLGDLSREQHAFLFARPSVTGSSCRLLVREMSLTGAEQLLVHTPVALELQPSYIGEAFERCHRDGLSPIEVHSHPFCDHDVRFSHTDVSNELEKFPWLAGELPRAYHATLVFGRSSVDGHYWDRASATIRSLTRLRVVGAHLHDLPITSASHRSPGSAPMERFARQSMAFGRSAQEYMATLTVGIVGVGGIGCALVEQLVHLGVRSFILVDPDVVEETNLNRLLGATVADVAARRKKVEIMERVITQVAPSARVAAWSRSVVDASVQEALKSADVIFGGTDSDGARMVVNRLAVSHLIPYFDLGTGLEMRDGKIAAAGGQIWIHVPGGFCLDCTGAIDPYRARVDLMDEFERQRHVARGYGIHEATPSVVFLNTLLASAAVGEFLNLLSSYKPLQTMIGYDALNQRVEAFIPPQPRPDCPTCARQGRYAFGDDLPAPASCVRSVPACVVVATPLVERTLTP